MKQSIHSFIYSTWSIPYKSTVLFIYFKVIISKSISGLIDL